MWAASVVMVLLAVSGSHQSPLRRLHDSDGPTSQQLLDKVDLEELLFNHPLSDNTKRTSYGDAFWKRGQRGVENGNSAFWKRGNDLDSSAFWKRVSPSEQQTSLFWKRGNSMEEPAAFWKRGDPSWVVDPEFLAALRSFVERQQREHKQQQTSGKNLSYEVIDENTREGEISPQEHKEERRRGENIQPEFNPSGW